METLVQVGLSNALAATLLAVLVAGVAFGGRRPALVHSFWLLVLLRLLVPPFLPVPIPWPNLMDLPEAHARLAPGRVANGLPMASSDDALVEPEGVRTASEPTIPARPRLAFWG